MKLYYTDERKNKQLIAEGKDIAELCDAADVNARSKFIFLKTLTLKTMAPKRYIFMNADNRETGYSIEE